MSCPFGFGARDDVEDEDEEELEDVEEEEEDEAAAAHNEDEAHACKPESTHRHSQKKQATPREGGKFEKDPATWFKEHNITTDKDFEAKRSELQQEARRRLEGLQKAKQSLMDLASDLDEMSFDDDLSGLDTDKHSLSSFGSHAEVWLGQTQFSLKAETCIKYSAPAALAVTIVCLIQSYTVMTMCNKVGGVVINTQWPSGCLFTACLSVLVVLLEYLSTSFRSKRMLLCSVIGLLLVYAAATAMLALLLAMPITLDERLYSAACQRTERSDGGSRLCAMMPSIRRDITEAMPPFLTSLLAVGGCALGLAALGIWYTFELAYVEKKAAKANRRQKRTNHTIPWDKIKVTAAATASWVASGGAAAGPTPAAEQAAPEKTAVKAE